MDWFKRTVQGLKVQQKKEMPEGLWSKCDGCGEVLYSRQMEKELWTCPRCSFHQPVPSQVFIGLLTDEGSFRETDASLKPLDPLKFKDTKRYPDRVKAAQEKTGLQEGVVSGEATLDGRPLVIAAMDFRFIGGSMGSVVGEKIARAIDRAADLGVPVITISTSGGARMQEGILSLMQMVKTSAAVARFAQGKQPYVSIMANPTTAGVLASFASLGDVILAEPGALIGFTGPRVIRQTTQQDLPEGFQRSEFLLEHGMVDRIVHRKDLRREVSTLLDLLAPEATRPATAAGGAAAGSGGPPAPASGSGSPPRAAPPSDPLARRAEPPAAAAPVKNGKPHAPERSADAERRPPAPRHTPGPAAAPRP